jgi:hypothetical protein
MLYLVWEDSRSMVWEWDGKGFILCTSAFLLILFSFYPWDLAKDKSNIEESTGASLRQ